MMALSMVEQRFCLTDYLALVARIFSPLNLNSLLVYSDVSSSPLEGDKCVGCEKWNEGDGS